MHAARISWMTFAASRVSLRRHMMLRCTSTPLRMHSIASNHGLHGLKQLKDCW
jgi:hypothetical protein